MVSLKREAGMRAASSKISNCPPVLLVPGEKGQRARKISSLTLALMTKHVDTEKKNPVFYILYICSTR